MRLPIRPVPTAAASLLALCAALPAGAQDAGVTYTTFGTPGLLEMPSAVRPPEGEIAATYSRWDGVSRTTFTFQVTDRLSGSFRYANTDGYALPGNNPRGGDYFDRSFDLRFRAFDEGEYMPSVTVGFQDFLGTGQFGAEYIVATKTVGDAFRVTAGLGWGRLATEGGFDNPLGVISSEFDERPELDFGEGGEVEANQFFRGDAALFGGVEYAGIDDFVFKLEYSSDAYARESELGLIDIRSPINAGVTWEPFDGIFVTGAYLYGSELAFSGTLVFNPNDRPLDGGFDDPPVPVAVRAGDARAALTWDRVAEPQSEITARIAAAMAEEGLTLDAIELTDRTARIRYTNTTYRTQAQGLGRAARILTAELPPSIEVLTLEPQRAGIPLNATVLQRSDLEALEHVAGNTEGIFERAEFGDAGPSAGLTTLPVEEPFSYSIGPYAGVVLFGGDNQFNFDVGLRARAAYEFSPSLIASGTMRYSLTQDNPDVAPARPDLANPGAPYPVRTNAAVYRERGNGGIDDLTLAYYARPGTDLYSRVTVGYLERMYGGVSTEVLYAPVTTRWAVGAELNYARQRDFEQDFGFQDYDVFTGHASLYYDLGGTPLDGFQAQVDVGRYLAGDYGATFALDREFENGWSVGGFFTLTDVTAENFGEGSFDKGIRVSVPIDWFLGTPTRRSYNATLNSLTRDGGARLRVGGRLYDTVRDGHLSDLGEGWGRFWR